MVGGFLHKSALGLTLASLCTGFAFGFFTASEEAALPAALTDPHDTAEPAVQTPALPTAKSDSFSAAPLEKDPPAAVEPPALLASDSPRRSVNYALSAHGATASGGERADVLIDGNHMQYDGASGFAHTEWNAAPPQGMVVNFREEVPLNAIRFLLWDQDNRFYRYKLEVCPDLNEARWKTVADRSKDGLECRGWQVLLFQTQTVKRVRLTGTFGSANSGFHVVELEAYDAPAGLSKPWEDVEF